MERMARAMANRGEYFPSLPREADPEVWRPFAQLQTVQTYEKDRLLYTEGDRADRFYYILSGSVETFLSSPEGSERSLTVRRAGNILGEASFFDGQPRMSSARVLTLSRIVSIDRGAAEICFAENPPLVFAMLKYLSGTVRILSEHVNSQSFLPAEKRIARALLGLCRESGPEVRISHEELGSAVGASRVTVSRLLGRLEARGLVRCEYRRILVPSPAGLEEFLSGT